MSTYYLAKGLQSLGHEVLVLSINTADVNVDEKYNGVSVVRVGAAAGYGPNILNEAPAVRQVQRRRSGRDIPASRRLEPYVRQFAPDVLHTNVMADLPGLWELGRAAGATVIHTLRSYSRICSNRMLRDGHACERQCRDCAMSRSIAQRDGSSIVDGVVGISRHILEVHRSAGWFADVSTDAVIANSYAHDGQLAEQNEPEFELGFIGRLHETKGIDLLLEVVSRMNHVPRKGPIRLLVAGSGNPLYVQGLKDRFGSENIVFADYIAAPDFFSKVRYCVVPSIWYEPFGRVFIESLAHGIPVIGSLRGGGADVLTPQTGWLIDPDGPESLERAIGEALDLSVSGYQSMREQCLDSARKYTPERIAQEYVAFYETARSRRHVVEASPA